MYINLSKSLSRATLSIAASLVLVEGSALAANSYNDTNTNYGDACYSQDCASDNAPATSPSTSTTTAPTTTSAPSTSTDQQSASSQAIKTSPASATQKSPNILVDPTTGAIDWVTVSSLTSIALGVVLFFFLFLARRRRRDDPSNTD